MANSIKVWARDEKARSITHPRGSPWTAEGTAKWPNDQFTQRRLADGTVFDKAPATPQVARQKTAKAEERPAG